MMALKREKGIQNGFVSIDSTQHKTTLLMHAEDKNLHGKIFGGYVLKLAYELAWVCVYKFLRGKIPVVTNVDDVQFLGPVEVGTTLDYTASICYIESNLIHVVVNCRNTKANGEERLTNVLHITFMHSEDVGTVGKVYPETIENMNQYIESMRRVDKVLKY